MKKKPKIICWDLDETLGIFQKTEYLIAEREGRSVEDLFAPYKNLKEAKRKGISGVLRKLKEAGYTQVITTVMARKNAEEILKKHRLDGYFDAIFGGDSVYKPSKSPDSRTYKDYRPVMKFYGLDETDLGSLLIIGNSLIDKPTLPVVFLYIDKVQPRIDSKFIADAIEKLENSDKKDFVNAFSRLYKRTKRNLASHPYVKIMQLSRMVRCYAYYKKDFEKRITVPIMQASTQKES